jgi:hypothetical protein
MFGTGEKEMVKWMLILKARNDADCWLRENLVDDWLGWAVDFRHYDES